MVGRLMRYSPILAALLCVLNASTATAQALRDPTRPPPAESARGAAGRIEQSGWVLQSVLISPERRYAIINGEVVALGGSIAGAELVAVAEERVTLRTREGLRIVRLFPDVSRLGIAEASPGATRRILVPDAAKDTKAERPGNAGTKQ